MINAATGGGNGFTVSGNYIGGKAALAGSTALTKSGGDGSFTAISVATATGTANSIQGNIIKNISWADASNFYGIEISGATVANIGTVTGNTIGATTGTGSIVYTSWTAPTGFYGIYLNGTGNVDCRNNTIGAITTASTATTTTPVTDRHLTLPTTLPGHDWGTDSSVNIKQATHTTRHITVDSTAITHCTSAR